LYIVGAVSGDEYSGIGAYPGLPQGAGRGTRVRHHVQAGVQRGLQHLHPCRGRLTQSHGMVDEVVLVCLQ